MTRDEAIQAFDDSKRAYQLTFNTDPGRAVMIDLEWFWRASASTVAIRNGGIDVNGTFLLEGRREVYLRIRDYLDLTPEQLVEKYTKPALFEQER